MDFILQEPFYDFDIKKRLDDTKKLFLSLKFESDWLQIPGSTVCRYLQEDVKQKFLLPGNYCCRSRTERRRSRTERSSLKGLDPYLGTREFSFLLVQIKDWKLMSSRRDKALPGIL